MSVKPITTIWKYFKYLSSIQYIVLTTLTYTMYTWQSSQGKGAPREVCERRSKGKPHLSVFDFCL